jgi:hypothetical protein
MYGGEWFVQYERYSLNTTIGYDMGLFAVESADRKTSNPPEDKPLHYYSTVVSTQWILVMMKGKRSTQKEACMVRLFRCVG